MKNQRNVKKIKKRRKIIKKIGEIKKRKGGNKFLK